MSNSWINLQDPDTVEWHQAGYYVSSYGFTDISGLIKNGTVGEYTALTLDADAQPYFNHLMLTTANDAAGRIDLRSDSTVKAPFGSNVFTSLDPIHVCTFIDGWTFPTLTGGWVRFSSTATDWAWPSYFVDPSGIVHLQGLVKSGGTGTGNPIFTLPANMRPEYEIVWPSAGDNGAGGIYVDLRINTAGQVYTNTAAGTYLSISGISFIPTSSSLNDDWADLTLLNSWVDYGSGFSGPQYLVAPDGRAYYRGLIKSGTTTAATNIFATPSKALTALSWMFPANSNGFGSVEVKNTGYYRSRVVSSTFLSLDNLRYRTDWV